MKKMIRTFHPVGHGAFYTERFYDETEVPIFTAVFDCGCFETAKAGRCSHMYEERIENEIRQAFVKKEEIDVLFISHLHTDHINGVIELLSHCKIKRIILPALEDGVITDAVLYNFVNCLGFNGDTFSFLDQLFNDSFEVPIISIKSEKSEEECEIEKVNKRTEKGSGTHFAYNDYWTYIPINVESGNATDIIKELEQAAGMNTGELHPNSKVDYHKVKEAVEQIGIKRCKEIYEKYYGDKHNSYSMVVFSCKKGCFDKNCARECHRIGKVPMSCFLNCLYMGDFEASPTFPKRNKNYESLKDAYQSAKVKYTKIGILQVPHHGSKNNLNSELYKTGKMCIISAESDDKYKHPDLEVLDKIQQERSIPVIVTENPKTMQKFEYDLK